MKLLSVTAFHKGWQRVIQEFRIKAAIVTRSYMMKPENNDPRSVDPPLQTTRSEDYLRTGRYKSRTGSTWITDLNKNVSFLNRGFSYPNQQSELILSDFCTCVLWTTPRTIHTDSLHGPPPK